MVQGKTKAGVKYCAADILESHSFCQLILLTSSLIVVEVLVRCSRTQCYLGAPQKTNPKKKQVLNVVIHLIEGCLQHKMLAAGADLYPFNRRLQSRFVLIIFKVLFVWGFHHFQCFNHFTKFMFDRQVELCYRITQLRGVVFQLPKLQLYHVQIMFHI